MDFYYHPISANCRKCMATLHLVNLTAEYRVVDILQGAHLQPDYLAINPNGRVPALVDGDLTLWESNVINIYLAEKTASSLWPGGAARLEILKWMFWEQAHLIHAMGIPAFQIVLKPHLGLGDPDLQRLEEARVSFDRLMPVLDAHLSERKFVIGESITLADLALASHFSYADQTGLPIEKFEHVTAWLARMDEIPEWKRSAPPPLD
jgi:glutathione S-transferase